MDSLDRWNSLYAEALKSICNGRSIFIYLTTIYIVGEYIFLEYLDSLIFSMLYILLFISIIFIHLITQSMKEFSNEISYSKIIMISFIKIILNYVIIVIFIFLFVAILILIDYFNSEMISENIDSDRELIIFSIFIYLCLLFSISITSIRIPHFIDRGVAEEKISSVESGLRQAKRIAKKLAIGPGILYLFFIVFAVYFNLDEIGIGDVGFNIWSVSTAVLFGILENILFVMISIVIIHAYKADRRENPHQYMPELGAALKSPSRQDTA